MVFLQTRREFIKTSIFGLLAFPALSFSRDYQTEENISSSAKVALVCTDDFLLESENKQMFSLLERIE